MAGTGSAGTRALGGGAAIDAAGGKGGSGEDALHAAPSDASARSHGLRAGVSFMGPFYTASGRANELSSEMPSVIERSPRMAKIDVPRTELCWPGKHAQRLTPKPGLPLGVVERSPGAPEEGFCNQLIWGDNLLVMEALVASFEGEVDLIYIDPPFATGGDFSSSARIGEAGPSIEKKAYRDALREVERWMDMMLPRLHAIHRLLKDTGSLYVHVDYRVSSMVRCLLDEIFGPERLRGMIVWQLGTGAKGRRQWSNQHNDILCYSKGDAFTFNYDDPALREPFAGISRSMHFNKVDKDGRRYRERVVNGKSYIYYEDEGRLVGSVWTDCPSMAANSPILDESVGYPTQKPEKLLRRILAASSNPNDLVADLFCGSGTTLAVAEKLGRRWIGCDLGRLAIHTTRKRILDIDGHKPFALMSLGHHERRAWQKTTFVEDGSAYRAFVLGLYGAEPAPGLNHVHGKRGGALVHVGDVDQEVTLDAVKAALAECVSAKRRALHVLGWAWHEGLVDRLDEARGDVDVSLVQIPREVMERAAADKHDVAFVELARADVRVALKGRTVSVSLEGFLVPHAGTSGDDVRAKVERWSDAVDAWSVDWDHRGGPFTVGWSAHRTRKERSLPLTTGPHTYEAPGCYRVIVKVVDVLGHETTRAATVEIL